MSALDLVIDIGNTALKYALFEDDHMVKQGVADNPNTLEAAVEKLPLRHVLVSSVAGSDFVFKGSYTGTFLSLSPNLKLPFKNLYQTPQTLGADRIAGVAGAQYLFPGCNLLSIDAGTCITYDFINADAEYFGGAISPGLQMRFKALHTFTGRLPLVEMQPEYPVTGRNTPESISSGVLNGAVQEMEGIIKQYQQQTKNSLTTVLCGGDARFFESKLKQRIFVIPELVLIGLHRILKQNV